MKSRASRQHSYSGVDESAWAEAIAPLRRGRRRERLASLGRAAGSSAKVHHALLRTPVCTIPRLAGRTRLTLPTIAKALDVLLEQGIVSEITGKKRNRVYRYDKYLGVLAEGTEPL